MSINKSIVMMCVSLSLGGCARPMEICGTTYQSYGILNMDDKKNPEIEYEVIWGNVFWGAILFETVIAPIYFFGFSIFNPVGKKGAVPKGAIQHQPPVCAEGK